MIFVSIECFIVQTETIDLAKKLDRGDRVLEIFARSNDRKMKSSIDSDGLPYIGEVLICTRNFVFLLIFIYIRQ